MRRAQIRFQHSYPRNMRCLNTTHLIAAEENTVDNDGVHLVSFVFVADVVVAVAALVVIVAVATVVVNCIGDCHFC